MFRKQKDAKLGQAMTELRDALAQISLKELKIQSLERALYAANEQIEQEQLAQDHRACYARQEQLEVELEDLKALRAGWNGVTSAERERAEKAEAAMGKMREAIEYTLELLREFEQEVVPHEDFRVEGTMSGPDWSSNGTS